MPKTSHRSCFNTVLVGQSLCHLFNMNRSFFLFPLTYKWLNLNLQYQIKGVGPLSGVFGPYLKTYNL
jgi:hypothetical protein